MTIALSPRTRQRLAGWICVLSYAWAAAAPLAHAGRVLPLERTGRYSQRDALNRPETITQGEQMTRYGYDLAGRAVMLIGGNGQVTENTYDDAGRLKNRVLFRSLTEREQDDVMAEFGWAQDAVGNVVAQHEVWPGSAERSAGVRATTMTYDGANRLETETITDPEQGVTATSYAYDDANNRDTKTVTGGTDPGFWDYTYNNANQLTAWEKRSAPAGTVMKAATLTYDLNGNRTSQTITEGAETKLTGYAWDAQDRLSAVTVAAGVSTPTTSYHYDYDYRTRRTGTHETTATTAKHSTIVFAGGLSLAEWETSGSPPAALNSPPTVEYTRGPDMGGGVGGLLYSARAESGTGLQPVRLKYNLSNGRGDVVAQSDNTGALTWTASYEAYGKRTKETGENKDKQRANTKDEDPTGLLNEGFRYRDIETGVWLSRDPAGFVDGPNLYAYVKQNPWTKFDPLGLWLMGYEGGDMDKNTARILNNVRQADPRLNRIVQELEDSPYPFQISAHFTANDSKTYGGEKGEFSPAELNPIKVEGRQRTRDCTGRKTLDRYNGKGMGGRIWSIGEVVDGKTPEETMAHELGHAFDCNRGISPLDAKKGKLTEKTILPSRLVDVDENENRAVRTENIYNEAKGNKLRTSYPVTPDNDRKQEAVPNPEGKNAPVNFEPAEKAPRRSPTSSARP